jgi:predicted CopG family antitoxin
MGKTHMYRAQILLEQQQHETLAKIARREKRSISDVVREIVNEWLAAQTLESQKRLELDALEQLGQIRLRIQEQRGVYNGDLLAEARSEREQDIERVWNGQP